MLIRRLGSTIFWVFLTVSSILLFPVALLIWAVTALVDRRLVLLHRFTCFWASLYTWLNPVWRVHVEGREKIDPAAAYVMVANHQSLLDILVLFRLFTHFKWVSKVENFKVPCIGWNMRLNRYIPLRRGDKESIEQMMSACEVALREGSSIMMFPEGTRSVDGRLKAFKHGAFTLAKRVGAPILPIVVGPGTSPAALPKRALRAAGSACDSHPRARCDPVCALRVRVGRGADRARARHHRGRARRTGGARAPDGAARHARVAPATSRRHRRDGGRRFAARAGRDAPRNRILHCVRGRIAHCSSGDGRRRRVAWARARHVARQSLRPGGRPPWEERR
ncbi:MAG: lysophospholipid acyltransferase family protein [Candidatus Binatia bacterium]